MRFVYWFALISSVLLLNPIAYAKTCPYRVSEKTLEQACTENLSRSRESKYDCLAAGRDEYIDSCALGICAKYDTSRAKTQCVQAARGRIYSDDDLSECAKRYFDEESEGSDCLAARGTSQARFQQLELAKEKGYRQGSEDSSKTPSKLDPKIPQDRADKAGKTVAERYLKTKGYNDGVQKGRDAKDPIEAASYAEGQAEGTQLAATQAANYDRNQGFNAALTEMENGSETPPESKTISLQADKTASLEGAGALKYPRVTRLSEGVAPVAPTVARLSEPSKALPTDRDPSYSDLPYVPSPYTVPTKGAPCIADDDRFCINAFKEGYIDGFKKQAHSQFTKAYQEAYQAAFESSFEAALKNPVPAEAVQEGIVFASKERGMLAAYSANYPQFSAEENKKGREQLLQTLRSQPLVRVASVHFESAYGKLLVPRNGFMVSIEVDNFGEVDSASGQYRISIPSNTSTTATTSPLGLASNWKSTSRVLPSIPARTRTLFRFAFEGTAAALKTGEEKNFSVVLDAIGQKTSSQLGYMPIQWVHTKTTPQFPVELVSLTPLSKFSGTQSVAARFTLKNKRAERSEAYTSTLSTEPKAIAIRQGEALSIPALDPGESYEFEVALEPTIWTSYRGATDFTFQLSDGKGTILSRQVFPYLVDLGMPLGIRVGRGGTNYSNQVIHHPLYSRSIPVQIQLDCTQKMEHGEGYHFRYAGSSHPGFSYVGTVGADVGTCQPGRPRYISSGSIWIPDYHVPTPASLKFILEKNGVAVQGVQVFVQTIAGTERRSSGSYCGTCP